MHRRGSWVACLGSTAELPLATVISDASHYLSLAAAYVRGAVGELALDDEAAVARGERDGLRLHRFKRTSGLPRVRAVLGALRGFGAAALVDLGSGRGAFVWPLLDALPEDAGVGWPPADGI